MHVKYFTRCLAGSSVPLLIFSDEDVLCRDGVSCGETC